MTTAGDWRPVELREVRWCRLLDAIEKGKCTPFLGDEVRFHPEVPASSEIARAWAGDTYPLTSSGNLPRVAQYIATMIDAKKPIELLEDTFGHIALPDLTDPTEPHRILASLDLPIYITTHCFDFMVQALQKNKKDARTEYCRWSEQLPVYTTRRAATSDAAHATPSDELSDIFKQGFTPTVANPVVYYLHGHIEHPESVVLTEDDYLDFLIATSRDQELIPAVIRKAFTHTLLLFIGYRIADLEFRVLLRSLVSHLKSSPYRNSHISVQLIVDRADAHNIPSAQEYLRDYFREVHIEACWGSATEFVRELGERWQRRTKAQETS